MITGFQKTTDFKLSRTGKLLVPLSLGLLLVTYFAVWQINKPESISDKSNASKPVNNFDISLNLLESKSSTSSELFQPEIKKQGDGDTVLLSEPGLFSVKIPEKISSSPRISKSEIKSIDSLETAPFKEIWFDDKYVSYRVAFIRYPAQVFQTKSIEALLSDLKNGQLLDYKAELKEENTSYDARNVIRMNIKMLSKEMNKDIHIRSSIVISEPFVFLLSCFSEDASQLSSKTVENFFSSFELFKSGTGKTIVVQ